MNKHNIVKKNIIEFRRDGDFYFERAEKFLSKGDGLSALENMRRAQKLSPQEPYFMFRTARIYSEMGLYGLANDLYFKLISQKKCLLESYFGLTQNYMEDDNLEIAYHYLKCGYERQKDGGFFDGGDIDMDIDDLYDVIEELEDRTFEFESRKGWRLVYDRDAYQKKILLSANNLMGRQEFEKALQTFAVIKPGSNFYNEALNGITLCHYLSKDYKSAEAVAEEAERLFPGDVFMLCNRLLIAHRLKEKEKAEKYLNAVLEIKDMSENERYRAAMVFCEIDYHGHAADALEKLLYENPYDPQVMLLYAQALYNGGLAPRAATVCRDILKIREDSGIARYYLKLFSESKKQKVQYACQVPKKEIIRRLRRLTEITKNTPEELSELIDKDAELFSLIKWCVTLDDMQLQLFVLGACLKSGNAGIIEYVTGLLISGGINTLLKKQLLILLLGVTKGQRTVHIVADDVFISVRYNAPRQLEEFPTCFKESYINVFATLALMEKGFEVKLNSVTREFLKLAEEHKTVLKDYKALSAVISVIYGGKRLFSNRSVICEIYNTNLTTLRAYLKKLGIK